MVYPHCIKMVLRFKLRYVSGSMIRSGFPALSLTGKRFFGSMWNRNGLPVVQCGLHTFARTMQRNSTTGNGTSGEKVLPSGLITTPQNVQVFADPSLAKCVRDLACDMQKVKTTLKFNKEEVADCVYEYIRLNNAYDSLKSTSKESSKLITELTKEVEGNAKTAKAKHNELEKCLLYFTEKTVKHENQMRDISKTQEDVMKKLNDCMDNLDFVADEMDTLREYIEEEVKPQLNGTKILTKILGADDGSLQVDVKKIADDLLLIRKLLNDVGGCSGLVSVDAKSNKSVDSEGEGPHQK